MLTEIKKHVDSVLLGSVFELRRANKLVQSKIQECKVEQFEADKRLRHSKEILGTALAASVERVERIEGKAMGTLLGVSVAVAVFGAASGMLGSGGVLGGHSMPVRGVAAVLLVAAMAYLFASGFLSLQAYKIGEVYRPTLSDFEPLATSANQAMVLIYCIDQNHLVGTLRSNRLSASFNCLRNGFAAIILLGVFTVIVALLAEVNCARA